jgi:peptide/nickel transport system permease protein
MKYIIRRVASMIPTMILVSLIIFTLMRVLPGDVAMMILMGPDGEGSATPEALATVREQLGLNDPLPVQYVKWMGGVVSGNAGESLWSGEPIYSEIGKRIGLTLQLGLLATTVSLLIAVPSGVVAAVKRGRWPDYASRIFSIMGLSIPSFWVGVLILLALVTFWGWSPRLGYVSFYEDPWGNFQQMIFPAIALGYIQAALVARMTRSSLLEVLQEDYIRTARSKGLKEGTVIIAHALRNSLLPVVTIVGVGMANIIGGTVVIETVFNLPGIGRYLVDAIFRRDYPVVQTLVLLFAFGFAFSNLLVDLLYTKLDPRIVYK